MAANFYQFNFTVIKLYTLRKPNFEETGTQLSSAHFHHIIAMTLIQDR